MEENGTVSKVRSPAVEPSDRRVGPGSHLVAFLCFFKIQVKPLLPPVKSKDSGKICVVIDLDETLVHSSFKVGFMKDRN